jgi:hypothetical protein
MPPRGRKPGFKIGRHGLPYWIASQVTRDPMGFPDTCIALPPDATDDELASLCQEHTARLREHIAAEKKRLAADDTEAQPLLRTRYDGTMRSACLIYQEHPLSRFHRVKHNTRRGYLADMKVIIESVGARLIKNVTVLDIENWYVQWRKGVVFIDPQTGEQTIGPERIDRAHNAVAMVRTVLRFMAALRHPECKVLAEELSKIQFERGAAREHELTYQQVRAFIRTAFEMADKGSIERDRALYLAIGTAAQFELMLRQKDIIGDWAPRRQDTRYPAGITILHHDDETWSGFFTWESIPGWRWRTKTSKSKYRSAADFDLTLYDLLFPLLELVPNEQRHGPIIKGEHGLPIRYRTYNKNFRKIAEVAGIPFEVQNRDARAGGITEAEEAGAPLEDIQMGATHQDKKQTLSYVRRRSKKIAKLAEVRKLARTSEGGGTA